jgi:hypothetical protein
MSRILADSSLHLGVRGNNVDKRRKETWELSQAEKDAKKQSTLISWGVDGKEAITSKWKKDSPDTGPAKVKLNAQ